jgi:transposase-like protein
MTGISLSELARRIGRSKSLVSRWAKQGKISRKVNGLFDEAAVRQALKRNLDPARSKPPESTVTMTDLTLRTVRAAKPATPFEAGFVAALVHMTYSIGAIGAVIAVDQGAPVEVGKAMEDHMTLAFMEHSEELMRCLPMFHGFAEDEDLPGITYALEHISKVNWEVQL